VGGARLAVRGRGAGRAPWRKRGGDRVAHGTVLGCGDAAYGMRWGHQLWRVLAQAGGERGRQVGLVVVEGDVDRASQATRKTGPVRGAGMTDDAQQGEAVAVLGARVGAAVAMDGAGTAAGREAEVRVAAGFGGGGRRVKEGRRVGGRGGGEAGVRHRKVSGSVPNG